MTGNNVVHVIASYHGIPTLDPRRQDYRVENNLRLITPHPGLWYMGLYTDKGVTFDANVTIHQDVCANKKFGFNCNYSAANESLFEDKLGYINEKIDNEGDLKYYIVTKEVNKLVVSVTNVDQSKSKAIPKLYAGFNTVPSKKDGKVYGYDFMGCNVQTCSPISSINTQSLNLGSNNYVGNWYIAVEATAPNADYYIWINNVCPGNCTGHGQCQTTGDNYGQCKCNDPYDGFSCINSRKEIEILILIIIGALVALSAILGLVAWAYMRNKSEYVALNQD